MNNMILDDAAVAAKNVETFTDDRAAQVKCAVTPEEVARVKGLGCLWDKTTPDCFNIRVITRNGKITAQEARAIADAAARFGKGEIAMTSRMTVEIQRVPFENIEPLRTYLEQFGLETGGTGPRVRPVVSCKGTTCQYGLIDTFGLSNEIHERFYKGYHDVKLPHKLKIAVGGCPNNCVRPNVNDLGIVGQKVPQRDLDKCRGCKKCRIEEVCPIRIAHVEEGKLKVDIEQCNHCGRCVGKCPFHVVEQYTSGYRIFIGGRGGKKGANGRPLEKIFTDREEVLQTVEKVIHLFKNEGIPGERFNDTVNRLGFENVQARLMTDEFLPGDDV
ncbi:MAG: 4Fe-4S binding protein [Oscillospiraceae bacterium]|nr:4Fe-4S binding protein [Oscillospiraceae bacterium]